jgi:hypothetical protein
MAHISELTRVNDLLDSICTRLGVNDPEPLGAPGGEYQVQDADPLGAPDGGYRVQDVIRETSEFVQTCGLNFSVENSCIHVDCNHRLSLHIKIPEAGQGYHSIIDFFIGGSNRGLTKQSRDSNEMQAIVRSVMALDQFEWTDKQ